MTPRSSSGVPSALVPVQWTSTKRVSPSTADRRTSAWNPGRGQQRGPVRAHLADSLKCSGRKLRLLAPIVLVEAGEHPFEVMRVLRSGQPVHQGARIAHRVSIRRATVTRERRPGVVSRRREMPAAADVAVVGRRACPPPGRGVHQRDRARLRLARVPLLRSARCAPTLKAGVVERRTRAAAARAAGHGDQVLPHSSSRPPQTVGPPAMSSCTTQNDLLITGLGCPMGRGMPGQEVILVTARAEPTRRRGGSAASW